MMKLALDSGRLVIVDDASIDERLGEVRSWHLATGLCALAAIPLRRGGDLVGTLLLCSRIKSFLAGRWRPCCPNSAPTCRSPSVTDRHIGAIA